jgi:hypothetical protein
VSTREVFDVASNKPRQWDATLGRFVDAPSPDHSHISVATLTSAYGRPASDPALPEVHLQALDPLESLPGFVPSPEKTALKERHTLRLSLRRAEREVLAETVGRARNLLDIATMQTLNNLRPDYTSEQADLHVAEGRLEVADQEIAQLGRAIDQLGVELQEEYEDQQRARRFQIEARLKDLGERQHQLLLAAARVQQVAGELVLARHHLIGPSEQRMVGAVGSEWAFVSVDRLLEQLVSSLRQDRILK